MSRDTEPTSATMKVKVSSAVPLTKQEQAALREKLEGRFGADLEIRFDVETSLLGGVVVRVGDQVIDGSVKGKLDALAQTLAQSR